MSIIWQNVAAVCLVVAALAYVAWRAWRLGISKKPPGCPTCSECFRWWEEAQAARGSQDGRPQDPVAVAQALPDDPSGRA